MSESDVRAGGLYVDVGSDTTGFGRELQRKIDAEVRNVRARVQAEIDSRRLATDLRRAVREAQASGQPLKIGVQVDRTKLAADLKAAIREVQAGAGSITVGVNADTTEAAAKIDEVARDRKSTIETDVDGAAEAEAELDKAARDRTAKIKTDFDMSGLMKGSSAILSLMKFPAIAAGVQVAAAAVAQLGAGLISLVSAAAPAVNLLGLIPAAGAAIVTGLAPVIASFLGIGKAVTAMSKQQASAASTGNTLAQQQVAAAQRVTAAQRTLRDAQQTVDEAAITGAERVAAARQSLADAYTQGDASVTEAERNLADAQYDAKQAQDALNQARADAEERLKAYADQLADAALNERGAELAMERAQQRLDEVNRSATSTDLDRREAQLSYDEAVQRYKEAKENNKDLQDEAAKAAKAGVDGSQQVVDAQHNVAMANRNVGDQEQALHDARVKRTRAIKDATQGLADAQREAFNANRDASENLQAAQEGLTQAIEAQSQASAHETAQMTALQTAMNNLSPAGQRFARFLHNTMIPNLREVQSHAQEAFLPPLQRGLAAAQRLLPNLDRLMTKSGSVMGHVAESALKMVSSGPWRRDFNSITDSSTHTLALFGKALNPILRVIRDLTVAGGPFVEKFAKNVAIGAKHLSAFVHTEREMQGPGAGLTGFFQRAYNAGSMLWDLLKDLAGAVFNIGQAAAPAGRELFRSLDKAVEKLKQITEPGTTGGNNLKAYFDAAVPGVKAIGRLFNGLVKGIGELGKDKSIAPLLDKVTTQFVPALVKALQSMGHSFGPAFVNLLTDVANLFADLGGGGGGLTAAAKALGLMVKAVDALVSLPGVGPLVKGLLSVAGAAAGIGLAVGGVSALGKRLKSTIKNTVDFGKSLVGAARKAPAFAKDLLAGARGAARLAADMTRAGLATARAAAAFLYAKAQAVALRVAELAQAAAAKTVAAAQWLLNAAMEANPIGIVIGLIVALGLAFIVLWKRSATFRKIVTGALDAVAHAAQFAWGWIKGHWPLLLGILIGPFGLAVIEIIKHWDKIKAAGKAVKDWLKQNWPLVLAILTGPFGLAVLAIVKHWDKIQGAAETVKNWLRDHWQAVLGFITNPIGSAVTAIQKHLGTITGAFHTAVQAIRTVWSKLSDIFNHPVKFLVNTVYNDGIRWAWNKIAGLVHLPELPEAHYGGAYAKGGVIPGYAPGRDTRIIAASPGEGILVPEAVRGLGGAPAIHAINAAYSSRVGGSSADPAGSAFGIGGVIGGIKDKIKGGLGGVWHGITGVTSGAKHVFGEAVGALKDAALGTLAKAMTAVFKPVRALINRNLHDPPVWRGAMGGLANRALDGIIALVKRKDDEHNKTAAASAGVVSGNVKQWEPLVKSVLKELGQPTSLSPYVLQIISHESGGNTGIVNTTDSNWAAGTPSVGLMQVIGPTFAAHAGPYRSTGPFEYGVSTDPRANIYAGLAYGISRYHSVMNIPGVKSLMSGGPYEPYHSGGVIAGRGERLIRALGGEAVLTTHARRMLGDDLIERLNAVGGPNPFAPTPVAVHSDSLMQSLRQSSAHAHTPTPITLHADRSVVFEDGSIQVNNPTAEPASDTVNRRLRALADMGVF